MTPLQKAVLEEIVAYRAAHGVSPTHEHLRRTFGQPSRSGAHRVLTALVRDGYLSHRPGGRRNYAPTLAAFSCCGVAPPGAVVEAARRLLAGLIREDLETGLAVVRAADLGDLDVALAEMIP